MYSVRLRRLIYRRFTSAYEILQRRRQHTRSLQAFTHLPGVGSGGDIDLPAQQQVTSRRLKHNERAIKRRCIEPTPQRPVEYQSLCTKSEVLNPKLNHEKPLARHTNLRPKHIDRLDRRSALLSFSLLAAGKRNNGGARDYQSLTSSESSNRSIPPGSCKLPLKSCLRKQGDHQLYVEENRHHDYLELTLHNIHEWTLESAIHYACHTFILDGFAWPERVDKRSSSKCLDAILSMLVTQFHEYQQRSEDKTLRGQQSFDWQKVNWCSKYSVISAWMELLFMEVVNNITWEGISPTSFHKLITDKAANIVSGSDDPFLRDFEANNSKKWIGTRTRMSLATYGIDSASEPSGMLDVWRNEIDTILNVIDYYLFSRHNVAHKALARRADVSYTGCHAYERASLNSREWTSQMVHHCHCQVWYSSKSIPIPWTAIPGHDRIRASQQKAARLYKTEWEHRNSSGSKIQFSDDVKCRSFDRATREIISEDAYITLRPDGRAGRKLKPKWEKPEETLTAEQVLVNNFFCAYKFNIRRWVTDKARAHSQRIADIQAEDRARIERFVHQAAEEAAKIVSAATEAIDGAQIARQDDQGNHSSP